MDSYIVFFALVGLSMCLLGLNMLATVITMRAPGPDVVRLPMFVWGVISTAVLMVLAAPVLITVLSMAAIDRTVATTLLRRVGGGSSYLFENLFWVFGHPEVYILALPGFGDRARAAARVLAQAALGLPARRRRLPRCRAPQLDRLAAPHLRQRHQLGSAALLHALDRADLDPDRLHLPVRDGDALARAHPLHRADAVLPRLGLQLPLRRPVGDLPLGRSERRHVPRQLLLDGPLPLHDHGRADLHLLRGDLLLAAEDDRFQLNERLGKVHFWTMFIAFNSTFAPLFALGFMGMPRRVGHLSHPTCRG